MGELIYHYTSLEALTGIIKNKKVELWATNYQYFNDPREYSFSKNVLRDYSVKTKQEMDLDFYLYLISFCLEGDSLNLWRFYSNDGYGISLGFDMDELKNNSTKDNNIIYEIEECIYCDESNKLKSIEDKINNLRSICINNPDENEKLACSLIKHISYESEKEVRLILTEKKGFRVDQEEMENTDDLKFRFSKDILVPYKIVKLPLDCLKEIYIGPKLNFEKTKCSIRLYLQSLGIEDSSIQILESKNRYQH